MSKLGATVIGTTGTPTNSQQGKTGEGSVTFNALPEMLKDKDATAFVNGYKYPTVTQTYEYTKKKIVQDLNDLNKLLTQIDANTWQAASKLKITKVMPGAFFKFTQSNGTNGVTLAHKSFDFTQFCKNINADCAISTSDIKHYQKNSNRLIYKIKDSGQIIDLINDKNNFSNPFCVSVIRNGNMGWDMPRLKYVSFLSRPSGKNVTNMQEQVMSRGNRMPFEGMYSHDVLSKEIAALNIPKEQKILLAEYVCFMCSTVIAIPNGSQLLHDAYIKFAKNTYTADEGKKLYMDAIENYVPKNNVTKLQAPHFTVGYSPGSLNQQHKKDHCEVCEKNPLTNKTFCEIIGRSSIERIQGVVYTDDNWNNLWFKTLVLDHRDGDRNNYDPNNLRTSCPTFNSLKTLVCEDHLNSYDKNGNKIASA
jgi:hypothetical protein